jgi:hypothetical protein
MARKKVFRLAVGLGVFVTLLVVGSSGASAADVTHGIGFTKGCSSPTKVGAPYSCSWTIRNNLDDAEDTLTINNITDTVHAVGGNVVSSTVLDNASVAVSGGATCTAPPNRVCTLPFNSRVDVGPFTFYTVHASDFTGPGSQLTDSSDLAWHDLCDDPAHTGDTNCNPNPPTNGAASASLLLQRASQTSTTIHDAGHNPVTVVDRGSIVHDFVAVTTNDPSPLQATPSGSVTVSFFTNNLCLGGALATSGQIPLGANGTVDATSFPQGPLSPGFYGFQATYSGDGTYAPSTGGCEPLQVVDANIQITPATATNRVGSNHTLTCHINVDDGTGLVNAPDGTTCTVSIISGPGSPGLQNCSSSGGTGSCNVTISSAVTGSTVIRASTNVAVAGLTLHRETGDGLPGDSPNAQKLWVNAAIQIAPDATNEIGHTHTFTATLLFDTGSGLAPAGAGQTVTVTLTGSNGANPNPAGPFTLTTDANGQVQVTFTSATPGKVTGHASWTGSLSGSAPFTVQTDGTAPDSGDAVKTFVDANIQISPAQATNPLNTNHTLHCHINVNNGSGAYTNAPDGTVCTVTIISGPGTPTTQNCTMASGNGTCDVTITSSVAGTSVIQASTSVSVGGVVLNRATGDTNVGDSANAQKVWINPDANIQISPAQATNPIGSTHTLTGHVNVAPDGSTFSNAPAGTLITFSIVSGPGSFVGGVNTCTTIAATGSCTVQITSLVAGTTVVRAATDVTVSGVVLHRETNDGHLGDSADANKLWFVPDANIQISPAQATNPIGSTHTLTGHVNVAPDGSTFSNAPAGTLITFSIVSGPGSFVGGVNTCTTIAATGSCTVQITSSTAGTTVVRAATDVTVSGVVLHRQTGDGHVGDSVDAQKLWFVPDANIQISPATATNPTGTTHVLTGHVNVAPDGSTFSNAPAGTLITFSIVSGPGSFVGGVNTCTTIAATGSCTVTITSNTGGTTVVRAATDVTVNGVQLHRQTNDGHVGDSSDAQKTWIPPSGLIAPTATSCSDFAGGTAQTLGQINYSVVAGKIGQGINPGVFFFYTKITTTTPNQVVTVTETNTSTNSTPNFGILNGQALLYDLNCNRVTVGTVSGPNGENASFTVAQPGTYIIGIKYQTKTIAGAPAPSPANITFNFATSLGGSTGGSVQLKKQ